MEETRLKVDLGQIIVIALGILFSLLLVLEINNTSLGSANWEIIAQNLSYVSAALIFFGMGLFILTRR